MVVPKCPITVIGAGLAGSECALKLAEAGVPVRLLEQKPHTRSPAHRLDGFAELVCSNSLKTTDREKAHGILKEELARLGSPLLAHARTCAVPAGPTSLAVDRDQFSHAVTRAIQHHPHITLVSQEVTEIPKDGITVLATGPLTSGRLARALQDLLGEDTLYFYDATSPIVRGDSLNFKTLFFASRYHEETKDYLNIPLSEAQYHAFVLALKAGQKHAAHPFEKLNLFSGCQPIEDMAASGLDTLRFGPFRPTGFKKVAGLSMPPYAVIQLRRETVGDALWNLVGCQTRLTHGEQKRIFRLLPGLERAEFVRYGTIHRNTFINSPHHLDATLACRKNPNLYFAGALTGAEGYTEAIGTGLAVAHFILQRLRCGHARPLPITSLLGALIHYLTASEPKTFQPMNVNRGLLPPCPSKQRRHFSLSHRSIEAIQTYLAEIQQRT